MKITIAKTFDFDAAHWLPLVPDGHKCKRLHGHTYRVEIRCGGPVQPDGMICDYALIAEAWAPLHAMLDHRFLNDVEGLENPTTEILCEWILTRIQRANVGLSIDAVRVYESTTTWAEARAE